jgi:nucleoside 2-deoxyribosyltransferase
VGAVKVYLAGPINGRTDDEAHGWRDEFMEKLPQYEYLDPMVRDYRGREDVAYAEIVELDKADILTADAIVAYCWQPSWGTAMELLFAWENGIPVIVVVPADVRVSPWLRYHSYRVVPSLYGASKILAQLALAAAEA